MATTLVRGANPVWSYVDLTGKQFDDTYYMWVLQNDIPYFPATVWHDPAGNVPWTNPIQFFANGTLPIDIYWDPSVVYRLEFRRHANPLTTPTQADPLIYLVENYTVGSGGVTPGTLVASTDNQISNPQFAEVLFDSPLTLTSVTNKVVTIAPGWVLTTSGTGNITVERTPLNNSLTNPTNAPYALHLTLSGFTSATLAQRFNQNGMLWTSTPNKTRYVASSLTARAVASMPSISARIVDSDANTLGTVLTTTVLSGSFNEYPGTGQMAATSNTDLPPDAWIEYQLILPGSVDVYLTSFQLIQTESGAQITYIEDTVERQIDHLFHYYRDGAVFQPKSSILTGWDFPLNPMQFNPLALTTAVTQTMYVADQTIIHQLAGSTVKTGIPGVNRSFQVQAINGTVNNRFALIQYVAPKTVLPYWSYILSSLSRMRIFTSHGTQIRVKMRLIWRVTLPSPIGAAEPIASWAGTDPVFAAGWTEIIPLNDPAYLLPNNYEDGAAGNAFPAFPYSGMQMPDWDVANADTYTLGIVIYTTANMNASLGTEDSIEFQRISLVQNDFAVDASPQTADQVLRECQYYYQKSFQQGTIPASALGGGTGESQQVQVGAANTGQYGPIIRFPIPMVGVPVITRYNVIAAGTEISSTSGASWTTTVTVPNGKNGFSTTGVSPIGSIAAVQQALLHWTADARLGT